MKKAIGILVCLLAVMLCACAAADVKIDEQHFPDQVFREYVKRFDTDGDGVLTDEELNVVDAIDTNQASDYVYSIQGIEYFQVLHKLDCSGSYVTNPDLKQNKQLKELDCHYCYNITDLDLSQNWALTSLQCDQCQLSSLDLCANPALEILSCGENTLVALDLKDHSSLNMLNCDGNNLNSLNLEGCTGLTDVVCSRNYLTSLDLRGNTALTSLDCDANQLTNLKLPTSIQKLVCSRNPFGRLDLSGLYYLNQVDCYGCDLTNLNLSGCSGMESLTCSGNQLTGLDLTDCSFLKGLEVSMNSLTDIDLSNCFVLSQMSCWDNKIDMLDISWCLNLSEAYTKGTQDSPLRSVTRYSYNGSSLTISDGQRVKTANDLGASELISIADAKITVKDQVYTGSAVKPELTVILEGKKLTEDRDYTASFRKNRKIGKATVTIKGKGHYTGEATASFRIIPKSVSLSKLTAGKKSLTVKWKKGSGIDGYEIEYSLKKNFKNAKKVTIQGAKTVKTKIQDLKAKKTYYVRVRAYKEVNGKKYWSAWSEAKSVKTKK